MDNKITRKRLSDLLSYEWILMLIICVVSIVFWELAYDFGAVKPTVGQNFRYYFDYTIYPSNNVELRRELYNKKTFSYDVLKLGSESINQENNVLKDRLSIQEGDVIFTDVVGIEEYKKQVGKDEIPTTTVRAFSMIDYADYKIGSIDVMLDNARKYLEDNFFIDVDDIATVYETYNPDNINKEKVERVFMKRNGKDNRFRNTENINKGIYYETVRIEKIYENVVFLQKFIDDPANSDAIIRYTRYSQSHALTGWGDNNYKKWMQNEVDNGRGDDVYAINLGKLKGVGSTNITSFMQYRLDEGSTDIVIMHFDFTSYQPHLQYESLSFICSTIRICKGE